MTHPLCHARNLITPTEAGERVQLNSLYVSFSGEEWARRYQYAGQIEVDEHGMSVADIERFLETLPGEDE